MCGDVEEEGRSLERWKKEIRVWVQQSLSWVRETRLQSQSVLLLRCNEI